LDQTNFDPNHKILPIDFFALMVHEMVARKPHKPLVINTKPQHLINAYLALGRRKNLVEEINNNKCPRELKNQKF
jgi:hypothetical protein